MFINWKKNEIPWDCLCFRTRKCISMEVHTTSKKRKDITLRFSLEKSWIWTFFRASWAPFVPLAKKCSDIPWVVPWVLLEFHAGWRTLTYLPLYSGSPLDLSLRMITHRTANIDLKSSLTKSARVKVSPFLLYLPNLCYTHACNSDAKLSEPLN